MIPIVSNEDPNIINEDIYFCTICKKWLKVSHTLGNIKSHLKNVHQVLTENQCMTISEAEKAVLIRKFILLNGLPFSIVENKHLKALSRNIGTRKSLSRECSMIAERVRRFIKAKYQMGNHKIYIIIDEWTDPNSQNYLGVHATILTRENNWDTVCIAHQPLSEIHRNSEYISDILAELLVYFFNNSEIAGLVTDTTPLMPSIAAKMGINWYPCYCHIMNLLLQDFIYICGDRLQPLLDMQRTLGSSTVFHNYIVHQNACVTSLPNVTPTRWYSLYKLMNNTLKLKMHIINFLSTHRYKSIDSPPEDFFDDLQQLFSVFATAKYVMQKLESDKFGTLSVVIDAFRLLKMSVDRLPDL